MDEELIDQADGNAMGGLFDGVLPDEEGRMLDGARRLGTDPATLKAATAPQLTGLLEAENRRRILARDQRLARWMADHPLYAALSHDDAPQLEDLGTRLDRMAQQYRDLPTTGDKWKATVMAPVQGLASGLGRLSQSIYGSAAFVGEAIDEDSSVARYLRDRAQIGAEMPSAFRWTYGDQTVEQARANTQRVSDLNPLKVSILGRNVGTEEIFGGAVSLLPTIAAGALTGGAMWAIAGAAALQSAGSAYSDLREDGKSVGEAGGKGLLAGIITGALTRVIPGAERAFSRMLTKAANPKAVVRGVFARSLGMTAAGELTEEGIDQFLNSYLVMGKPLNEAAADAVQAGLIGGILGGAVGVSEAHHAKQMAQAHAAESTFASERDLIVALDSSKTAERSKEVIQSYMQTVNPALANERAFFDPEVVKQVMAKPEAEKALAGIGVTKEMVGQAERSGSTVAMSRMRFLTELPAEIRDALHEHARSAPDAVSKAEATETKDAQAADGADEAAVKKAAKELRAEETRLIKEVMAAGDVDEKTARTSLRPLLEGARGMFSRNPAAAKEPIALLKKVTFQRGEDPVKKARQALVDLGGKTGNARATLTDELPDGIAARVDALTGQREFRPEQVGQALMDRVAAIPEVQLAGKKVRVQDEAGQPAEMDAADAVGMLRERLEAARRLKLCVEGA